MWAVVKIGAKQYKISRGDTVTVDRISNTVVSSEDSVGRDVLLDKILLYHDGEKLHIGTPFLDKIKVRARLEKELKDKKVVAFKFRRRKNSKTKRGHRQILNILKINGIVKE